MSPAAQALLRLEALEKRFVASADGEGPHVLRGVDLELEAGERCAIVGPSGSGKSTLLHLVGGLAAPSAGRVLVDGEDLASFGEERLAQFRNQRIGLVFQEAQLLPQLSALENALLPALAAASKPSAEQRERAEGLLARVGLAERRTHPPGRLSGGERQRVALVRALLMRPRLLLADEPTGALDEGSAEALGELLIELNEEERTALLVVTHHAPLAARMGRVCELAEGRLREAAPA